MDQRIDLAPNCSLTPAAARVFFAATCAVSLPLSLFFTLRGFWPILMYWVLEMLVLGLALQVCMRRRWLTQTVLITEDSVALVTRSRDGEAKQEFARHWARVRLRSPRASHHPSRLTIESHGRACEVGSFLTEEERCRLAVRLSRLVGPVNASPQLSNDRT
jgi:uncharacterized membrane protein